MTFALSGHRRPLRLAVHGAALAAWAVVEVLLIASWPSSAGVAGWTAAGAALAWNGVRRGAGRETLTVTPRFLELRRRIGPFRLTRRYERDRVAGVRSVGDRIEFVCAGRPRRFGRNLSAREAACIVHVIRKAPSFHSPQNA